MKDAILTAIITVLVHGAHGRQRNHSALIGHHAQVGALGQSAAINGKLFFMALQEQYVLHMAIAEMTLHQ